jgi:hypothetical protein
MFFRLRTRFGSSSRPGVRLVLRLLFMRGLGGLFASNAFGAGWRCWLEGGTGALKLQNWQLRTARARQTTDDRR